jgi:hypothetical protein
MTFICYAKKNFRAETLKTIEDINSIIEEYAGVPLSLRQVYYQMVARGMIENTPTSYDKIGDVLSDGRMAGLISWLAIEDRNRSLMGYTTFNTPEGAMTWLADEHYRIDMWEGQTFRPEVWVEKAALEGVVGSICNELRVDFFSCRGYNSQSEQWRAGKRLAGYVHKGQQPIIFHLGDHDPSGIDMTRDNRDRLSMFAGTAINVVRIALNMNQVEQYRPPPNPAKVKDSRFADYQRKYGEDSWELDALAPDVISGLISEAVAKVRDEDLWSSAELMEAEDKETIRELGGKEEDDQG